MSRDPYLVQSVLHAAKVLEAFSSDEETLRLREVIARTGLSRGIVFRLLYTLERASLVLRTGKNLYRKNLGRRPARKFKIGYAAQGAGDRFSQDVTQSLEWAARQVEALELLVLDNHYSRKAALRNVETFIRERVDLIIEFQTDEAIAPVVSSRLREAGIPFIAVDIPHPGATYFGADNYQAGLLAGRHLGRWARQNWQESIDEILLLELPRAGSIPQTRLTGFLDGVREVLRQVEPHLVVRLDGSGRFEQSWHVVRRHLRRSRARRVLIGGINDPSVLGALRAFEEAGRLDGCAAAGQGGSQEGRAELRRGSRFLATVAYFPERYGNSLIRLAMDILQHRVVPPAVFIEHRLLTHQNVDRIYAHDRLLEA